MTKREAGTERKPRGKREKKAERKPRSDREARRDARSRSAGGSESAVVLYRCRMPTNYLCPCGSVERRLKRLGVPHRTERSAQKRSERPEIAELTGQRRLPVLVDGEEIVHDSRRINQYLEWRYNK